MILVVNRTEKNVSICVSKRPLSYGVCRFILLVNHFMQSSKENGTFTCSILHVGPYDHEKRFKDVDRLNLCDNGIRISY